jgi:COP9 signalosome complex subunit 1
MLDQLEGLLTGYKTKLIKESIRMGQNDLGDFYYERGDLQASERL